MKIKSIKEIYDYSIDGGGYQKFDGFEITTTSHVFRVLVSNSQDCCEQIGYIISEDDVSNFLQSTILEVKTVDTALNTRVLEETTNLDDGDAMFINFDTDKGVLQFSVYNSHNGYYGHDALFMKDENIVYEMCV